MLPESKQILLAKGIRNGGYISIDDARCVYVSKEAARTAMMSLESWGYIKATTVPGFFRVRKAPPESHQMAKRMTEAEQDNDQKVGISEEI